MFGNCLLSTAVFLDSLGDLLIALLPALRTRLGMIGHMAVFLNEDGLLSPLEQQPGYRALAEIEHAFYLIGDNGVNGEALLRYENVNFKFWHLDSLKGCLSMRFKVLPGQ